MLTLYVITAIVGGGLIVASQFLGHEHAYDHGGGDVPHVDDAAGAPWIPFLSLRFWTYFAGTFGICGVLLSTLAAIGEPITAVLSAATGLVTGLLVSALVHIARRAESDSNVKTDDLLGSRGKLLVGCRPGHEGKVRLEVKGETIEMLALPFEPMDLEAGQHVAVLEIERDRALVMPVDDLME